MAISAPRDDNRVPTIIGVSSSDGSTPVVPYVDPTTHRLLVDGSATSPGGSDGQVQFNNGGSFGGNAGFTYNSTTHLVSTSSIMVVGMTATSYITIGGNSSTEGILKFYEKTGDGSNYTALTVGSQAANITYTLPRTATATNTFLANQLGDGTLTWIPAVSGSSSQVLFFDGDNNPAGDSNFTWASSTQTLNVNNIIRNPSATGLYIFSDGGLEFSNAGESAGFFLSATDVAQFTGSQVGVSNGGFYGYFDTSLLTADRTFSFPDQTGTFALEDVTIPPATDASSQGPRTADIALGTTVAAFQPVQLGSNKQWGLTDATTSALASGFIGLALTSGTITNLVSVALKGSVVRNDGWSWTIGTTLYLSAGTASFTSTPPSGTNKAVRVMGYALTTTSMYFSPSEDYITNA